MRRILACLSISWVVAVAPAGAQLIKLATLVPDGSVWDQELRGMGEEWKKVTGGRVTLRVYPGGVAGDEPDVLRKMRIGQLQAGTLTVGGLTGIDDGFTVFQIPLFYDSYDELFHVLDALTPALSARLEAKGFVLVNWGHAGWIHLFTTEPVRAPGDFKKLKLFAWAGDNRMVQWWKENGYKPVPLAATDILTGLETGMIQALPTTPLAALSLQWYRSTPYMLDLGLAPLVGATVVTQRAWSKIAEGDQRAILAAAKVVEKRLEEAIPDQDRRAVEEMAERGMKLIVAADSGGLEVWRREAEAFSASMREAMVPADLYAEARKARDAYRAAQGEKAE